MGVGFLRDFVAADAIAIGGTATGSFLSPIKMKPPTMLYCLCTWPEKRSRSA